MQSCLEKRGMNERTNEIVRSDYNINDPYSAKHSDALSNGDEQGKGSGSGGHTYWKPHHYSSARDVRNMIKYDNFDTSQDDNIGGCYDINGRKDIGGRKKSLLANVFSSNYQYNADIIGTKLKK